MKTTLALINKEQAIRLKNLGFDWKTDAYYLEHREQMSCSSNIIINQTTGDFEYNHVGNVVNYNHWNEMHGYTSVPTQALVLDWFLLKFEIHIEVIFDDNTWFYTIAKIATPDAYMLDVGGCIGEKESFKESLSSRPEVIKKAINVVLDIIEKKKS